MARSIFTFSVGGAEVNRENAVPNLEEVKKGQQRLTEVNTSQHQTSPTLESLSAEVHRGQQRSIGTGR